MNSGIFEDICGENKLQLCFQMDLKWIHHDYGCGGVVEMRLAFYLGSVCGGSKGSQASKIDVRRQLLLKLIGYFNCCRKWQKLDFYGVLVFWF
jgi:hypothetical protein